MTIKSTFFLTTLHTVVKVLSGVVLNKFIAVYAGPSGLAILAQFQNFSGIVTGFSNGSIQTGVVKKTAENDSKTLRLKTWSSAAALIFMLSLISTIVVYVFSEYFSEVVFFDTQHNVAIQIFAFSILLYSSNLFFLAVLNGLNQVISFTYVNVCLSISQLLLGSVLLHYLGVEGLVYGLIMSQLVVFVVAFYFVYKSQNYNYFKVKKSNVEKDIIIDLLRFGGVSFLSGILLTLAMFLVRYMVIEDMTMDAAGMWEGAYKISIYFNMLFSVPLMIHYVPLFSKINSIVEIRREIKWVTIRVVPVSLVLILITYYLDSIIVKLLFSEEFLPLSEILVIVLLGEVFRIVGGINMALFMSKQMFRPAIVVDLAFFISFISLVWASYESELSLDVVAYAYLFSSFVFCIISYSLQYLKVWKNT